MATKIAYWVSTGLPAALLSIFAGLTYLLGNTQTVQEFAHLGYQQQLRIILGIAKLLGAIVLVVPGIARVKEWAYPDSHSRGSRHLLRTIWRKMAREHSYR